MIALAIFFLGACIIYGCHEIAEAIHHHSRRDVIAISRAILTREVYIAVNELYAGRPLSYNYI